MVAMDVKKACMDFMNEMVAPTLTYGLATWKVTDKSLVYYYYLSNESNQSKRVTVPIAVVQKWATN